MAYVVTKQVQSAGATGAASQIRNSTTISANVSVAASAIKKATPVTNEVNKEISVTVSLSAIKREPSPQNQIAATTPTPSEVKRALALTAFKLNFVAVAEQIIPLANAAKLNLETAKTARNELVDWSKKYNDFFK